MSAETETTPTPTTEIPRLPNTYQLKPKTDQKFKPEMAKKIISRLLNDTLEGHNYMSLLNLKDDNDNPITDILAENIKKEILDFGFDPRYKFVSNVQLVQNSGAGCRISAVCSWDGDTDNKCVVTFRTETFVVMASVFAFYYY